MHYRIEVFGGTFSYSMALPSKHCFGVRLKKHTVVTFAIDICVYTISWCSGWAVPIARPTTVSAMQLVIWSCAFVCIHTWALIHFSRDNKFRSGEYKVLSICHVHIHIEVHTFSLSLCTSVCPSIHTLTRVRVFLTKLICNYSANTNNWFQWIKFQPDDVRPLFKCSTTKTVFSFASMDPFGSEHIIKSDNLQNYQHHHRHHHVSSSQVFRRINFKLLQINAY